ncbi:MAG: 50S ribosomal protein L4 [Spirochaetales bacterium]|nr:MAG: 50S ribosomal protein L4 [Spirochaetales bacterium]
MILDKLSKDGKVVGQVELDDRVFNAKINDGLIYELVKAANANLRQGTHCTKERSFVSGGGAKPYKQKGTGRARQGSIRAPQWKGGGTIFGPQPRDYRIELPKGMRSAAYRALLSLKAKEGSIRVVEDLKVESGKTREIAVIGKALNVRKGVLVTDSEDSMLKRALRNIPWFVYNNVKRISGRDIFYSKTLVLTEGAVKYLNEKYAKGE